MRHTSPSKGQGSAIERRDMETSAITSLTNGRSKTREVEIRVPARTKIRGRKGITKRRVRYSRRSVVHAELNDVLHVFMGSVGSSTKR